MQELVGFTEVLNPASHTECSEELTSEITKAFKLCLFLNERLKTTQVALHTDYFSQNKDKKGSQENNKAMVLRET